MDIETFWNHFLSATNRKSDVRYSDCFHFDVSKQSANALLALVMSGKKQATASSLDAFVLQAMEVPKPGDFSIVTDFDGKPHCVIETKAVTILPFGEMTYDICVREGEDDCLASWIANHRRFFMAEGKQLGYQFSEDMLVLFEDFEVVYRK